MANMKTCLLIVVCLLGVDAYSGATEFTGKVVAVIDGNTFEVLTEDQQLKKFILAGIDSPEPGQPYSDKAKKLLEKLILEEKVIVQVEGKNRWGYTAIVTVVKNNSDPRLELLEQGLAWTSEQNPIEDLEKIRAKAQKQSKGLWKDEEPTAPWIYRREQSMLQAKSS
jgi:micrococcal nuclease